MIYKRPSSISGHIRVTFELPASIWADHIYLVGDFNDWDVHATPLLCTRSGIWRVTLDLPAGQRYEFRYLIDGRWCTDHHADGCVTNAFRTLNSYVDTDLLPERLAGDTAHSMVHEATPEADAPMREIHANGKKLRPRTPSTGRVGGRCVPVSPTNGRRDTPPSHIATRWRKSRIR